MEALEQPRLDNEAALSQGVLLEIVTPPEEGRTLVNSLKPAFLYRRQLTHQIRSFCFVLDSALILGAILFSYWLRFTSPLRSYGVQYPSVTLMDYLPYVICASLSLLLVLHHKGVYEPYRLLQTSAVLRDVVASCLIWGVAFISFPIVFKLYPPLSRLFVANCVITAVVVLGAWRVALRYSLTKSPLIVALRQRVLVVGWTEQVQRLADNIVADPFHRYQIAACVAPSVGFSVCPPRNLRTYKEYADVELLVRSQGFDVVLVADTKAFGDQLGALANLCEEQMVQFNVVPSYFNILLAGLHLETISGVPVLGVSRLPMDKLLGTIAKRAFDLVGATFGLLLSAPVIVVFGALVYLESPGPVLYKQKRVGRHGRGFEMLKIRSMRMSAPSTDYLQQSTRPDDPRLLRVGAFMRRWNVDELPQFWNVITGDMSLVGPRPERLYHSERLKQTIPHYNVRYSAKPGMTGWAQINGLRGATDLTERIRHDLFYMERWSLLFDLQIIVRTFFSQKNAC